MSEEVKEILDKLNEAYDIHKEIINKHNNANEIHIEISLEESKQLLDYITSLQEENKEAHDFDETMKDIKEGLIARIQRQECEIDNLKKENKNLKISLQDRIKQSEELDNLINRIDKAIEYLGIDEDILNTCEIYDVNGIKVYKILKGEDTNE